MYRWEHTRAPREKRRARGKGTRETSGWESTGLETKGFANMRFYLLLVTVAVVVEHSTAMRGDKWSIKRLLSYVLVLHTTVVRYCELVDAH